MNKKNGLYLTSVSQGADGDYLHTSLSLLSFLALTDTLMV